ncbi:MAG: hypothetical protein VX208_15905, partial [SAR324 cluster bacterium]|nr:hypothetical protein [SAR324 cluster bacterium]
MKIQNIFNFGLILLISAALMLSGCAKEEDSSSSTAESGGGSSDPVSQVVTALQGAVKTFGSSSSSRSAASTGSSVAVDQGVKSLVSLYLLIDTDYKYPVAKVKSAEDGSYSVTSGDVKDFLVSLSDSTSSVASGLSTDYGFTSSVSVSSSSSSSDILTAFKSLGPLAVRALYVKDGKAKAITAMADPTSSEPVRVDPIVSRVATQVIGKLVETIKATINSISILPDSVKATLLTNVLDAVKETVVATLESVKDTTVFELPEGTDASTISDPESLLEVEMDESTIAELNTEIQSTEETVTIDTTTIAVADTGQLSNTLTDAEKGALDKVADNASQTATSSVASTTASQDTSSMTDAQKAALASASRNLKISSITKFYATLGFPVMLEQYSDNSSVVAVPIKVPESLKDSDLPGRATFGDVSVRHFAVKDNSSIPSTSDYYGAPLLKTDFSSFASTAFPNGQSDVDTLVGKGFETLKSETDNFSKIEKLKAYWQLARGLSEGMPLVSMEAVGLVADNDNKTVTLKELAKQMASITEWQQERISFANNIPIFTGNFVAPSTGKTVKANDLITALTRKIGTDAKSTGKSFTDDNEYFWAPFAAHALKEQIIRNASAVSSDGNEMLKLIPDNKSGYRELLIGGEFTGSSGDKKKVPPSPAFMEARSKVARGLAAALPASAYSTSSETKTLNGETELDAKGSTFLITYMLELEYPISKQKGLFSTESAGPNTLVFPNIE